MLPSFSCMTSAARGLSLPLVGLWFKMSWQMSQHVFDIAPSEIYRQMSKRLSRQLCQGQDANWYTISSTSCINKKQQHKGLGRGEESG